MLSVSPVIIQPSTIEALKEIECPYEVKVFLFLAFILALPFTLHGMLKAIRGDKDE